MAFKLKGVKHTLHDAVESKRMRLSKRVLYFFFVELAMEVKQQHSSKAGRGIP